MTSPRADVLVKEGTVEAVEFLGRGQEHIVLSVFNCLHLFTSFECCEAIPPPLYSAGLPLGPPILSFPNPTFIPFHHKALS